MSNPGPYVLPFLVCIIPDWQLMGSDKPMPTTYPSPVLPHPLSPTLHCTAEVQHHHACRRTITSQPQLGSTPSPICCDSILHVQGDFSGSAKEGGIKHCLQLQDAGALNPVAYLNGLAKAVTDMGGTIYESTRVRKPDRSVLQTEAGNKVRAHHSCSPPDRILGLSPREHPIWFKLKGTCSVASAHGSMHFG